MIKTLERLNKKIDDNFENFLLILDLLIFIFVLQMTYKLLIFMSRDWKGLVYGIIFLLIYMVSSLLIIVFFALILEKIIIFKNIKPTITKKERKKLVRNISSLNKKIQKGDFRTKIWKKWVKEFENIHKILLNNEVEFENWFYFFISSLIFMTGVTPFFWTLKTIFFSIPPMLKNNFSKNKKEPYYAWRKTLNKNKKNTLYTLVYLPN